jgi:GNAT superfamily N-acetyltransferase
MSCEIFLLDPADAKAALDVVNRSFAACVAPDYTQEGRAMFARVVTAEYLRTLPYRRGFTLVARVAHAIVGMCAFRDGNHVTLFFVLPEHQGQGIGRRLFAAALARVRASDPSVARIEVHSSPFAVPVYQALGFLATGPMKEDNGIRYLPMALRLD